MNDRLAVQYSGKTKHKPDHATVSKRADQYRADFLLRFQRKGGIDLEILDAPDLSLKLFDLTHFGEALDVSNDDGGVQIIRRAINSLSQFTSMGLVTYASKPEA